MEPTETERDELISSIAVRSQALRSALQAHATPGLAEPCKCSLCLEIKMALADNSGETFRDAIREACAQIADAAYYELKSEEERGRFRAGRPSAIAKDISNRIRVTFKTPSPFPL